MKLIPTTPADLEKLKSRAKVLKRRHGGPHREALNKAAQEACYLHWHHAVECQKASQADAISGSLRFFCQSVANDALRGETHYLANDDPPWVFVANGHRSAFVLDTASDAASLLVLDGDALDWHADDTSLAWNSRYKRAPESIEFHLPDGQRHLVAVDQARLEEAIAETAIETIGDVVFHDPSSEEAHSLLRHLFLGEGLEPITNEVVELLTQKGYQPGTVQQAIDEGAMFSRPRCSLVYPMEGNL
jgi:hypothetical protein